MRWTPPDITEPWTTASGRRPAARTPDMATFPSHTADTAPEGSKATLAAVTAA